MFINCQIIRETPKAILVSQSRGDTDGGDLETWLPKSQIEGYKFNREGFEEVYIIIPEWLGNKNGIGEDENHPVFGIPVPLEEMKKFI